MGLYKTRMMEDEEERNNSKLADILGITLDELNELDYFIDTDESKDGLIYTYRVELNTDYSNSSILKKVKNLEDNCRVYVPTYELDDDRYYQEELDAILKNKDHLKKFDTELINLKSLLSIELTQGLRLILNRQIYISVISTMETFLSEVFINLTIDDDDYLKNFISTHPSFRQKKIEFKDIYSEYGRIEETARKVMLDTIYHNLPSVSNMFKDTFGISFPPIGAIYKYVMLRHDLVHRNGMSKDGNPVPIGEKDITLMMDKVSHFVSEIANSLNLR